MLQNVKEIRKISSCGASVRASREEASCCDWHGCVLGLCAFNICMAGT